VRAGRAIGIRRTRQDDPYTLQGHRVVERIKPKRFTGLGLVPNPADQTAELYRVRADAVSEEQPHAETIPPASADAAESEKETMSDADIQALRDKVAELERNVATLTNEKEQASAEAARIPELQSQIDALTGERDAARTELASVTAERDTLRQAADEAARNAAIDSLVTELASILEPKDEERDALREQASAAYGDDAAITSLKKDRQIAALTAKVEALTQAPPKTEHQSTETNEHETFSTDTTDKTPVGAALGDIEKPKLEDALDYF
jgi:chromosome segregation ATPase